MSMQDLKAFIAALQALKFDLNQINVKLEPLALSEPTEPQDVIDLAQASEYIGGAVNAIRRVIIRADDKLPPWE